MNGIDKGNANLPEEFNKYLFQSFLTYFSSYKLLKILVTKTFLLTLHLNIIFI